MGLPLSEFTFEVSNLGVVEQGSFTPKPLTLFCGPNNSGKTWTLYSLYYFYKRLLAAKAAEEQAADWNELKGIEADELQFLFNTVPRQLQEAAFALSADSDWPRSVAAIKDCDVFLMPAERNGLHLFFRELSTRRAALLHHASRERIDIGELLRDVIYSRYALPIADYIDWLNSLAELQREKSDGFHSYAELLKRSLAGGSYRVDPRTGSIEFRPYRIRGGRPPAATMGLHITSSTVKSLFGLWFYLEYRARAGDILMIDEPELNVHPENQRKIARLLAKLVNAGINVVISTHSDYIVREFNSLIMLSQDTDGKLRRKHRYEDSEVLLPEQVGAYLFANQTIQQFRITPEDGIYATTFDEVISQLNRVNDDIFYSLREQRGEPVAD